MLLAAPSQPCRETLRAPVQVDRRLALGGDLTVPSAWGTMHTGLRQSQDRWGPLSLLAAIRTTLQGPWPL